MLITQKRIGDRIAFLNENGTEVASLFDNHEEIGFDPFANSLHLFAPEMEPERNYQELFLAAGITAAQSRLIDSMPVPDRSAS